MFGINRKDSEAVVTLDLHTTSPGERRQAITRNRPARERKPAGINLYHRADQFLIRSRIYNEVQTIFD